MSNPAIPPSKRPKRKATPIPIPSLFSKTCFNPAINLSSTQPIGAPIKKITIKDQNRLTPIGITKIGKIALKDFWIFSELMYLTL